MYYEKRLQFGFGGGLTPVVRNLIVANVAIYFLQLLTVRFGDPITRIFALRPDFIIHNFGIWQLGTYLFLHSVKSFFHILFNMFTLWMFGCEVERSLGSKKFFEYYMLTGIGAGLFHLLFSWGSPIPVIGASGAIYGVLVAFAVLFPDRVVTLLLFFVFPVSLKAKYLVGIFVGISIFSGIQGQIFGVSDHVAHLAHLGGALVGFVLLKGNFVISRFARKISLKQQQRSIMRTQRREEEIREKQREVDRILDRINEVGYDGISDAEKEYLKRASEYLSKK